LVKVAIYTRVSTEDQATEGFSLAAQRERLLAYCSAHSWDVFGIYEDDGYSGRNIKRPGYQALLKERDKWDMILVAKMDRIHRNSRNFMEMMDSLRHWNKEFSSMQESLDTSTAMGRFVVDIIQRIAQLESEQIGERVYLGMKQKAKSAKGLLGSRIPFGYRMVNGEYKIRQQESKIVKRIFNDYKNDLSLSQIAKNLNIEGYSTRAGKNWSVWSIRYILHNPIYAGYLRWEDIVQKWSNEPIISKDEFNLVQHKLDSNRRDKGKNIRNKKDGTRGIRISGFQNKNNDDSTIFVLD
jgi:DNA invertase Pin-like site-specific DNA recombinase